MYKILPQTSLGKKSPANTAYRWKNNV